MISSSQLLLLGGALALHGLVGCVSMHFGLLMCVAESVVTPLVWPDSIGVLEPACTPAGPAVADLQLLIHVLISALSHWSPKLETWLRSNGTEGRQLSSYDSYDRSFSYGRSYDSPLSYDSPSYMTYDKYPLSANGEGNPDAIPCCHRCICECMYTGLGIWRQA